MPNEYIVFTDVDETLIRPTSMVGFMDHLLERDPFAARPAAESMRREFAAMKAARSPGADRASVNERYYRLFAGLPCELVARAARGWFEHVLAGGDLFISATLDELVAHQQRGAELVLVSGSFTEVLSPILSEVRADALLCTELESAQGVYTGRLRQQVIGEGKWQVIRRYLAGRANINLADCHAYGDHVSDACYMEKVGHVVVVGASGPLLEIAGQRNWRVLPTTANPAGVVERGGTEDAQSGAGKGAV